MPECTRPATFSPQALSSVVNRSTTDAHRPILVTGHHRAGTTWIGKMIAASRDVGYVHEPFNPEQRPGICAQRPDRYYTYVPDADSHAWRRALQNTLAFRYDVSAELRAIENLRDVGRMVRDFSRFAWLRSTTQRALIKDPIALFSAPWIAREMNAKVIVIIRHPAAFVSSLLRLNWTFPFDDLLGQPKLLTDVLAPFEEEIRHHAHASTNLIEQASLAWRLFHHVIRTYREEFPSWMVVRMEDVALDPITEIGSMYHYIGLEYNDDVRQTVQRHTRPDNPEEVDASNAKETRRDSRRAIQQWSRRLSDRQIERLYDDLFETASDFYAESDWVCDEPGHDDVRPETTTDHC
jgi:hypothetical protein